MPVGSGRLATATPLTSDFVVDSNGDFVTDSNGDFIIDGS